jgi:hypothetical protein
VENADRRIFSGSEHVFYPKTVKGRRTIQFRHLYVRRWQVTRSATRDRASALREFWLAEFADIDETRERISLKLA